MEVTDHSGKLQAKENSEFSYIDGVYIPSKITKRLFGRGKGELSYEQVSVFKNVQINHIYILLELF